jgi:hypothetical protein
MGTDDQKQADGKGKKGEVDPDTKARLDDFQRKLEEAEQARKVAEQTAREQRLEGRLRSALAEAGVGTEQQEKALVWLRSRTTKDGKPVLSFNADGNPVWRTDRQGFVDELDVAEGLKGWAATDDGKSFLPPTGAAGTGDSAGGRGGSGRRDPNPRKKDGSLDVDELRKRVFSGLGSTEFAT